MANLTKLERLTRERKLTKCVKNGLPPAKSELEKKHLSAWIGFLIKLNLRVTKRRTKMTLRELKQMHAARRQAGDKYRNVTTSFKESRITPSEMVRQREIRRATNQLIAIVVGAVIVAAIAAVTTAVIMS